MCFWCLLKSPEAKEDRLVEREEEEEEEEYEEDNRIMEVGQLGRISRTPDAPRRMSPWARSGPTRLSSTSFSYIIIWTTSKSFQNIFIGKVTRNKPYFVGQPIAVSDISIYICLIWSEAIKIKEFCSFLVFLWVAVVLRMWRASEWVLPTDRPQSLL